MFYGSNSDPDVSNLNTSSATSMFAMFYEALWADPDVSNWDTSSVTDMSEMFQGAKSFNQDISHWDTSNKHFDPP